MLFGLTPVESGARVQRGPRIQRDQFESTSNMKRSHHEYQTEDFGVNIKQELHRLVFGSF